MLGSGSFRWLRLEIANGDVSFIIMSVLDVQLSVRRARKDALDSINGKEEGMPIDEVKRQEKKVRYFLVL